MPVRRPRIVPAAVLAVLAAGIACGGARAETPAASQAADTGGLTADQADVRLRRGPEPTVVRVGQTIGLTAPLDSPWLVTFDTSRLQLLTPADRLLTPGPGGWVWRATAAGETTITLTQHPVCASPPCPPMAAAALDFAVSIR